MHILVDILILAILVFCGWQGYKRGIIGGILAVVFIIVALYGGNLLASAYSDEFTPMFRPFVSGYLDRMETEAIEEMVPEELQVLSTEDLFRLEPELEPIVIRQVFTEIGVHHSRVAELTERYLDLREDGLSVNGALTEVLVYAVCFFVVYIIAFLLIIIALTVIYNIIPFSFHLPGLRLVDGIVGSLLGVAQGVLLVFILTWVVGYIGFLLPEGLLERTFLVDFFTGANPMVGLIDL